MKRISYSLLLFTIAVLLTLPGFTHFNSPFIQINLSASADEGEDKGSSDNSGGSSSSTDNSGGGGTTTAPPTAAPENNITGAPEGTANTKMLSPP